MEWGAGTDGTNTVEDELPVPTSFSISRCWFCMMSVIASVGVVPSTSPQNSRTDSFSPEMIAARRFAKPTPARCLASASASAALMTRIFSPSAFSSAASRSRRSCNSDAFGFSETDSETNRKSITTLQR